MANGKNRAKVKSGMKKVGSEIKKAEKEIKDEIILNVPNSITLLRLLLVFVFVYMLFMNYSRIALFIVFAIAAVSDWFDGFFARKLNQKTQLGARLDQVIDRVFTGSIFLALLIFIILNSNVTTQDIFKLSPTNIFLLLFLSVSREIIGLPGFIIAIIRNKDPYQVRYIGKVTTFIQSIAFAAIILQVNWAIYLAILTCISGVVAGFDYLKYSLS
ncbi:CDP-diacylglycerol--glycerol-3-phosphate 3-phosphatidyltransferase [uncultured archaeon]|nr:CDP-diacylglycerol--glycerol-3-phosphate 3-phosphatidyltransferase [uncultured archaeon]